MAKKPIVVIAFGGNALIQKGQTGTFEQQMENLKVPMRKVVALAPDYRVVISHGNGPQVGSVLLQQDSTNEVPQMPVDVVGAMTQGAIGYMIEQTLERTLAEAGLDRDFLTVMTMVEVDANDPLFQNPTKPIGPFYTEEEAAKKPYQMVVTDKGHRRVIASPKPIGIVPHREITQLVEMGWIMVCSGGGGIPVVSDGKGGHRGVEAVIDKDLASSLLAREIGADLFVIATDVPGAAINWGKPDQRLLRKVTLEEMQKYVAEGHFPSGSMGPKVAALVGFVEATGKRAIICDLDEIEAALAGEAGTEIG
ncbi:MAG: carbamate kinase [Gaiellaceae bacterium]